MPEPDRLRLYGEADYQADSWKGPDTRIIYKAEVNQKGDNPRFIVTSIKEASAEDIYEDLYCPRGQDENFIKHLKSDLSGDRLSDQSSVVHRFRFAHGSGALNRLPRWELSLMGEMSLTDSLVCSMLPDHFHNAIDKFHFHASQ